MIVSWTALGMPSRVDRAVSLAHSLALPLSVSLSISLALPVTRTDGEVELSEPKRAEGVAKATRTGNNKGRGYERLGYGNSRRHGRAPLRSGPPALSRHSQCSATARGVRVAQECMSHCVSAASTPSPVVPPLSPPRVLCLPCCGGDSYCEVLLYRVQVPLDHRVCFALRKVFKIGLW